MDSNLQRLIEGKREWSEPLAPEDVKKGFKGWYSSKYLPHSDVPGVRQYVTYRLADSLPAERCHEWAAFLKIEDNLEKQRRIEGYLDRQQSRQGASGEESGRMALEQRAVSKPRRLSPPRQAVPARTGCRRPGALS